MGRTWILALLVTLVCALFLEVEGASGRLYGLTVLGGANSSFLYEVVAIDQITGQLSIVADGVQLYGPVNFNNIQSGFDSRDHTFLFSTGDTGNFLYGVNVATGKISTPRELLGAAQLEIQRDDLDNLTVVVELVNNDLRLDLYSDDTSVKIRQIDEFSKYNVSVQTAAVDSRSGIYYAFELFNYNNTVALLSYTLSTGDFFLWPEPCPGLGVYYTAYVDYGSDTVRGTGSAYAGSQVFYYEISSAGDGNCTTRPVKLPSSTLALSAYDPSSGYLYIYYGGQILVYDTDLDVLLPTIPVYGTLFALESSFLWDFEEKIRLRQ